jgi:hypothetical protein
MKIVRRLSVLQWEVSDVSSNERTKGQHCDFRRALSVLTKGYLTTRLHPIGRFVGYQMPRKSEQICEESETFVNAAEHFGD